MIFLILILRFLCRSFKFLYFPIPRYPDSNGNVLVKWLQALELKENLCKEINQSDEMASDGVLGKVKLEFNSLISFPTLPQAFIAVALNPGLG